MTSGEGMYVRIVFSEDGLAVTPVSILVTEETIAVLAVEVRDTFKLMSLESAIAILYLRSNHILLYTILTIDHKPMITNLADIIFEKLGGSDYYAETFKWRYDGNYISFSGKTNYQFQITGYLYPELYLRDSRGKYTWAKRAPEDCIR